MGVVKTVRKKKWLVEKGRIEKFIARVGKDEFDASTNNYRKVNEGLPVRRRS